MTDFDPEVGGITEDAQIYFARAGGMSFSEIAKRAGISVVEAVGIYRAYLVQCAQMYGLEKREQVMHLELDRLDMLQVPYFKPATQGSHKDLDAVLKIMTHRMKLIGLDQSSPEKTTNNLVLVTGTAEDFIAALNQGRQTPALAGPSHDDEGDQEGVG